MSPSSPDHLDFEHLSNSLFHEWNNFDSNAIINDEDGGNGDRDIRNVDGRNACDDTKIRVTTTTTTAASAAAAAAVNAHRNRIELEAIFRRVGLQQSVASRLTDEVYNKLGLNDDQSISFTDFLTLVHTVHSDTVAAVEQQVVADHAAVPTMSSATSAADEYTSTTCSRPLNEHMIFDLHASSGLFD